MGWLRDRHFKGFDRTVLMALSVGPLFWAIDSVIKAFFFKEGSFLQQVLFPSSFSLWMRLFVIIIMGLFGIVFIQHKSFASKLAQEEEKYKALFEDAGDAMVLADTNGNLIEANRKAEALLGYSKKELSKMNFMQLHPKEELAKVLPLLKEIAGEKGCFSLDTAVLKKDDTIVCVSMTAGLVKSSGEKYIQGIFRGAEKSFIDQDATIRLRQKELQDTQESLVKQKKRLQELEQGLQEREKQMEAKAAAWEEQKKQFFLRQETFEKEASEIKARAEAIRQKEERLLTKEQECIRQSLLLKDAQEKAKGSEAKINDPAIQARIKELEQTLAGRDGQITAQLSKMLELEEKVKSMAAALKQAEAAEKQLREKSIKTQAPVQLPQQAAASLKSAADTASSRMAALGQFANGVALEMNSPLTNIVNNAMQIKTEIQQKGDCQAADLKNIVGSIEESALRCKSIVQIISAIARPSSEQLQPVALNEVINKMTSIVEGRLRLQNVAIKKQFQLNAPAVMGNPHYLQLVIFNFLACARWSIYKKAPKEGGTITITTSFSSDSNLVSCSIADTGVTPSDEDLSRIFEPFYIASMLGDESGLDLSYAKKVIADSQGSIEAVKNESQGLSFIIMLPAVKEEESVTLKKG